MATIAVIGFLIPGLTIEKCAHCYTEKSFKECMYMSYALILKLKIQADCVSYKTKLSFQNQLSKIITKFKSYTLALFSLPKGG